MPEIRIDEIRERRESMKTQWHNDPHETVEQAIDDIDFLLAEVDRLKAEVAELRNPDALTSYEREQTRPLPESAGS